MLKLKLQYFGHLMRRVDSLEKTLMLGGIGGRRRRGGQRTEAGWHHWLDGRESQWTPGVGDGQGGLACCDSWGRKESDTAERLIWSDLKDIITWMVWFLTISIHLRYFSFFPHIIYSPAMNRFVYILHLENIDKLFFEVIVMHAVSKVEYLTSAFWILMCIWVTWGSS